MCQFQQGLHKPRATLQDRSTPALEFENLNRLNSALDSLFLTFFYWSAFGIPGALIYFGKTNNFDPKKFIALIVLGPISLMAMLEIISNRRTSSSSHQTPSQSSQRRSQQNQPESQDNSQIAAQQPGEPETTPRISSVKERPQGLKPEQFAARANTKDADDNTAAQEHSDDLTSTPSKQDIDEAAPYQASPPNALVVSPSAYGKLGSEVYAFSRTLDPQKDPAEIARTLRSFIKGKRPDNEQLSPLWDACISLIQHIEDNQTKNPLPWLPEIDSRIKPIFSEQATTIAIELIGGYFAAARIRRIRENLDAM